MFSLIRKNFRCLLPWSRSYPCWDADPCVSLAARFLRDRSGAYLVMLGLMAPFFIGALAVGSETGLWYATQAKMQDAADSSAISAAIGVIAGDTNWSLQANSTTASDGFVNGSNGTVVTVNNPPKSGPNTGTAGDIEVIISQPQKLFFSGLFLKSPVVVKARAVAGAPAGVVCVLALNKSLLLPGITAAAGAAVMADQCNIADNSPSPLALTEAALASITAQKVNVVGGYVDVLGTMTTTQGVHTGSTPTQDPFTGTTVPAITSLYPTCAPNSFYQPGHPLGVPIAGTVTLSPGRYCGGIIVGASGNVTLSPGTYYLDMALLAGGLTVASGGSLTDNGTGVTIVLTSSNGLFSNLANLDLGGLLSGGVINLTAPTSGTYAKLVLFVDPNVPLLSLITFRGGTQNNFAGTIYAPSSQVVYALGGTGTKTGQCTRLIADTIIFAAAGGSFSKCAVPGSSATAPASLLE
jgi:hypothetical protein